MMIRTQVYLPKSLYRSIQLIAKKQKKPSAAFIREALEAEVAKEARKTNAGDALLRIAELGERLNVRGPKDLSVNIDNYLYEDD